MARRMRGSPFSYKPGNSLLHRLPAGLKLGTLFLISIGSFLFGPRMLVCASILVFAGAVSAGVRIRELFAGSRLLIFSSLLVLLMRSISTGPLSFNRSGFTEGLLFGWGIMISFSAAALLFSLTTMTEIKESLERGEKILVTPFAAIFRRIRGQDATELFRPRLSLGISLMLGFLPRFFEIWDTAKDAYSARGGKAGLKQLSALIPLVTERMIESASETAEALQARGALL